MWYETKEIWKTLINTTNAMNVYVSHYQLVQVEIMLYQWFLSQIFRGTYQIW